MIVIKNGRLNSSGEVYETGDACREFKHLSGHFNNKNRDSIVGEWVSGNYSADWLERIRIYYTSTEGKISRLPLIATLWPFYESRNIY